MLREEAAEVDLRVREIVRREAPHVHRDGRVVGQRVLRALVVGEADAAVYAGDGCALHDARQVALGVSRADAARDRPAWAERVAHAEADHAIVALPALSLRECAGQRGEAVAAVEVVGIDHGEGFVDGVASHPDGVVRAPGLGAPRWAGEALGQVVHRLKDDIGGDVAGVARQYAGAEVGLEIVSDNKHDAPEACASGVEDGVVHDRLTVWPDAV